MSMQPTQRTGARMNPGQRRSGDGCVLATFVVLVGMLVAASGWAAQVVEVRVGRHPDFTRVVFELDRSAGYRIERSDPSAKSAELIVSLDAGSIPRRIQSSKSFIEQVVVEPSGSRSVARIRLAKGGLALKEMILASPPRIVLDVIADQDEVTGNAVHTAATSSAARPSTNKSAATPTPKAPTPTTPAPKPVATLARTDVKPEVKPEAKTPPPAPTNVP